MTNVEILPPLKKNTRDVKWYVDEISGKWNATVQNIMEICGYIVDAEKTLSNEDHKKLESELKDRGIGPSTISKLRRIGQSKKLFQEEHYHFLPPSYNYLYEIAANDKLTKKYDSIVSKLSAGEEYADVRLEVMRTTGRASKKGKGAKLQQVLVLSADLNHISPQATRAISAFIDSMKGKSHISLKTTPSWNKHMKE